MCQQHIDIVMLQVQIVSDFIFHPNDHFISPPCVCKPCCNSSVLIFYDKGKFCSPPPSPLSRIAPPAFCSRILLRPEEKLTEDAEHPPGLDRDPSLGRTPSRLVRSRTLNRRRRREREISKLEDVGGGSPHFSTTDLS